LSAEQVDNPLGLPPPESVFPGHVCRLLLVLFCLANAALGQSTSPASPQSQSQPQPQQKEDSVADAARKAKDKKGKSEPGKVYTEEDLSGLRSNPVSVVGQGASEANASPEAMNADAKPEAAGAAKSGKNDEEYWRGRTRKIQDQIAAVDQAIEKTKDEIKKYGNGGYDARSGAKKNVIYIIDRGSNLKELEKKKEELEKQLELLREEGRKAGAPAEWFR
jgi:hypothetical protein